MDQRQGSGKVELINFSYPLEELDQRVQELAEKLTTIPLTQLISMKLIVNQAYDNMGLQGTQTLGPILDGIMRNTPEGQGFRARRRIGRRQGRRDEAGRSLRRLQPGCTGGEAEKTQPAGLIDSRIRGERGVGHLLSSYEVIDRIFMHIDNETTDLGEELWREPIENYRSAERFAAELELFKRLPLTFCPSAALPDRGSYIARHAAGTPLLVVRGDDGAVRAFRNAPAAIAE